MKFHINKKGEVSKCAAEIRCPLGGEHFDTPEEATAYFEEKSSNLVNHSEKIERDLNRLNIKHQKNYSRMNVLTEEIRSGRGSKESIEELSKLEDEYWSSMESLREKNYEAQLARQDLIDAGLAPSDSDENWVWGNTGLAGQVNKDNLRRMHKNADIQSEKGMGLYKHSIADELSGINGKSIRQSAVLANKIEALPPEERTSRMVELFQDELAQSKQKQVFVDIETNGGHPSCAEIIQIGVIKTDEDGNVTEKYEQKFSPSNQEVIDRIGVRFSESHKLNAKDLKGKPKFNDPEVQKEMRRLLMDSEETLVSHNKNFENQFFSAQVPGYRESRVLSATHFANGTEPGPQTDTRALYGLLARTKGNSLEEVSRLSGVSDYSEKAHNASVDADYSRIGYENLKEKIAKSERGIMPILDQEAHDDFNKRFRK